MLRYDSHKGFCHNDEPISKKKDIITTNGLDQLDWESYLPYLEEDVGGVPEAPKVPVAKLKKEQRQLKKVNAARTRLQKRQQKQNEALNDAGEFNQYTAKNDLKSLYSKIIALSGRSRKEEFKVFQYHSIATYKSDLDHILPGEWLNDNNISLIYELINRFVLDQGKAYMGQIQLLFPSLVHLFLHFPISTVEDLESILPMKELRKLKLIFIPINFIDGDCMEEVNTGDHWALCLFSVLDNTLYVYDSMADDAASDDYLGELVKRLGGMLVKKNIKIVKMKCDQQDNFDDCGVYLIMITCYLINQLVSGDIDLNMGNVKLNALSGRVEMMRLVYEIAKRAQGPMPRFE